MSYSLKKGDQLAKHLPSSEIPVSERNYNGAHVFSAQRRCGGQYGLTELQVASLQSRVLEPISWGCIREVPYLFQSFVSQIDCSKKSRV